MTTNIDQYFVTPAPRPPLADSYAAIIRDAARRRMATPSRFVMGAAPGRGDKVTVKITGYVTKVDKDGNLSLSTSRHVFADPIVLDTVHPSHVTGITFNTIPDPVVGDIITGERLREVPWRRGTVIRYAGTANEDVHNVVQYVLLADGTWRNVNTGGRVLFGEFLGRSEFSVEYAPGKAA